jgi:nucleotide-binding universal stress UspA family protein
MADWFGSQIHMLYVHELLYPSYGLPEDVTATAISISEEYREKRRAEFESFLIAEFARNTQHRTFAEGDAAGEIVYYARNNDVGLIMMPTHGYAPFRRFLLGSVTAKVLHDATCPVWTGVHTAELLSENPEQCKQVLCAVDIDPPDVRVVRWAAEFAGKRGCDVQLVHAVQGATPISDESDPRAHESGPRQFREFLFQTAHEAIAGIQREAGTAFPWCVRAGKPERVVHDVAQDLRADLVLIGRGDVSHPLGRLRSHAYAIIRESPRPVISI